MASLLSRCRPDCPIFAFTNTTSVRRRLNLQWGLIPFRVGFSDDMESNLHKTFSLLKARNLIKSGDLVIAVSDILQSIQVMNVPWKLDHLDCKPFLDPSWLCYLSNCYIPCYRYLVTVKEKSGGQSGNTSIFRYLILPPGYPASKLEGYATWAAWFVHGSTLWVVTLICLVLGWYEEMCVSFRCIYASSKHK